MAGTGPKRCDTSFGLRYVFLLSYLFNSLLTTIIISTICIIYATKANNDQQGNSGQHRSYDNQHRPSECQHKPTRAHNSKRRPPKTQHRPMTANAGQLGPTTANTGHLKANASIV